MRLKIILLLILSGLNLILTQSINCNFGGSYQCNLILNNPQGFDNFTSIGGNHLAGQTNADVNYIGRSSGTSQNFPSIICEQFPNVLTIEVNGAQIQTLTNRSFAGCRIVTYIDFYNNRLSTPPVDLLVNNPLLEVFRVYSNNIIDALPEGLFDPTPNLTWICHELNPTGKFLPQLFRGLTKMDEMHIDTMNLNEFSNCLLRPMVNLRYLRVYKNQIKVLHQKSFPPTKNSLTYFDFDDNQIEAIDRRIFDDTARLSTVGLLNNICISRSFYNFYANRTEYMAALEPCFAEYDRRFPTDDSGSTCNFVNHAVYGYTCELINFNVTASIINNHPDCLSDSDVTGLIFTSSKIDKIPSQIFSIFPNLKFIEAVNVGLETALIENCGENLKFIDVSRNSIRSLPSDSFNCENIEEIIADQNCILSVQSCESTFVENLKNLKSLSMQKTLCVDKKFNLEEITFEEIEIDMKKCFKMWFLM